MKGHSEGVCLFGGMQDYDGVEPLTAQRLSADGSLGALAVHDEGSYDEVQQWPACLCLHVRGIDDRQAAGAQTLFDDTVQDRECGCGRGLVRFVVRDDGTAGVGRHDLGRLEVLLYTG